MMDKLYWIVCEESDKTLFEGRYLGRTRGAAMKHLKEQLGRASLTGMVFSITEIPVPLIREIVAEILGQDKGSGKQRKNTTATEVEATPEPTPFQNTKPRPQYDWEAIKECYMEGRGPSTVARLMDVPLNTLRGRIRREGWAQERRSC